MKPWMFLLLAALVSCGDEHIRNSDQPFSSNGERVQEESIECSNGPLIERDYIVYESRNISPVVKQAKVPSKESIQVNCRGVGSVDKCKEICQQVTKRK